MAARKRKYSRILIKLSGEALQGDQGFGIDPKTLQTIAKEVYAVHLKKIQVAVVIGGGNIMRGEQVSKSGIDRTSADYMGMMATMMNAVAIQAALDNLGADTRLQSALHLKEIGEPYIRRRAVSHLEAGRIVIFAGGTGNPYFTTDTTAALRGSEIEADLVFKATNVDGIYDSDPRKNKKAKKYDTLSYMEVLSKELRVMDATAIALCKENNLPICVFNLNKKGSMLKAAMGEKIGTLVGSIKAPTKPTPKKSAKKSKTGSKRGAKK